MAYRLPWVDEPADKFMHEVAQANKQEQHNKYQNFYHEA